MQNVPKIVLKRLQETGTAEVHPDPDLLTAFAEQSLAEAERAEVMEHLAHCGDCREVVALALPASETETRPRSQRAARGAWLTWPILRWGLVAAGIVLVTSAGVLQYKQRTQPNAVLISSPVRDKVRQEERAIVSQAPGLTKRTPMQKTSRGHSAVAAEELSLSRNAMLPAPQPMNRAGGGVGPGSGGGIGGGVYRPGGGSGGGMADKTYEVQAQNDAFAFAPASKEAMPTASQNPTGQSSPATTTQQVVVSGSSQVVQVQTEAAQVAQNQGQIENPHDLPVQRRNLADSDVVKAKDLAVIQASGEPSAPAVPHTALGASPLWAINRNGGLQRSFDGGKVWEDVNISPVFSAGSMQMANSTKYRDEKVKKIDKAQSAPFVGFRAVAAIDPEVWAGGSGAMLFHSIDSGTHWTQVLPSQMGAALTGDITAIEFSDPQHGRVATSAGELWITADDGQSWTKQP
ncbi:MAG: YCF48-related protein [Candidatus Sulfotelmatobacter sp.]